MSDNWVVQNLEKALNVWNDKLSEIWQLITQSPTSFKGGTLWNVVSSIHGALQAIGYALLVLFFVIGVSYENLWFPDGSQTPGTRIAAVRALCPC